ncbi:MAG: TIGR02757 family protein [bacterium]|nr:MAG: TIGR02757 family protein [bacterium]
MAYPGLKRILDNLYCTYDFSERLLHDPIRIPHQYKDKRDIEVAGFIASALAYGRVTLFTPVIDRILAPMGKTPAAFIADFDPKKDARRFDGIKYRFNNTEDIVCLIYALSAILGKYDSIEKAFLESYDGRAVSTAISGMVRHALSLNKTPVYGQDINPTGFKQFFPSPERGSSCKRMNLFLRWMVRSGDIDFGIWKGISANRLVIPLDTHIARISRCLGLTGRRSRDWKMAEEITESLRILDPDDPLKYDFALCHQGIMGLCRDGACTGNRSACPVLDL